MINIETPEIRAFINELFALYVKHDLMISFSEKEMKIVKLSEAVAELEKEEASIRDASSD